MTAINNTKVKLRVAGGLALAAAFGGAALAQGVAAGLSSQQIAKATTAVNGHSIAMNATGRDWPSVGFNYSETRFQPAEPDKRR